MKNVTEFSIRLYRRLARSFPEDFLRSHGDNMTQLSEDLIREAATRGRPVAFGRPGDARVLRAGPPLDARRPGSGSAAGIKLTATQRRSRSI